MAQSNAEKLANEHLIKMQKKLEIQSQKKETDLRREKPADVSGRPSTVKKATKFIVEPQRSTEQESLESIDDRSPAPSDPSLVIEQDVQQNRRELPIDTTDEEFIREFQQNAEKAGLKLKVDPKTLEVKEAK